MSMTIISLIMCLFLQQFSILSGGPAKAHDELMKIKSEHAQAIFKYLALGDLEKVKSEAGFIEQAMNDAGFDGKPKQYVEYGHELLRVVKELKEAAAKRNFAGSYYQFSRMSSVCFSCHEHLRDKKEKAN